MKVSCLALLPVIFVGYIIDAEAAGESYEFSANSGSPLYLEFKIGDWRTGATEYFLGSADFGFMSPYTNPAANFINANSNISGQFSYDTRKNLSTNSSSVFYRDIDFSLNLASQTGEVDKVNMQYTSAQASYDDDFFGGGPASFFMANAYGTQAPVEIGGCISNCGSTIYEFDFDTVALKTEYQNIFDKVDWLYLGVTIDNSFASYRLDDLMLQQGQSRQNRVDHSLSPILKNDAGLGLLELNFGLNTNMGVAKIEILNMSDTGLCDGGCMSDSVEYQEKKAEVELFLNEQVELNVDLIVDYSLTSMDEKVSGGSALDPVLPMATSGDGFEFTLNIDSNEIVFIDPEVAIGYDYESLEGANFLAVLLPEGFGDNLYDLWLFDEAQGDYVDSGTDLVGGELYEFTGEGLSLFRILGIEADENLDPNDPEAFVTGLKFVSGGVVTLSQTALTQTVVPVPPSILFFMSGIVGLYFRKLV